MFIIDNNYIQSLKPCEDRHQNYLAYYKDCNHTIVEFLQLEHISYEDKVWVWRRFATKTEALKWSLKCAQSVLKILETRYPNDQRPRNALVAVENYLQNPTEENRLKCNKAAAYSDEDIIAYGCSSANYAAYAAAAYAADANFYSVYCDAASAANYAVAFAVDTAYADAAYAAKSKQKALNLQFLVEIYKER